MVNLFIFLFKLNFALKLFSFNHKLKRQNVGDSSWCKNAEQELSR